jgi:hypothetical protein
MAGEVDGSILSISLIICYALNFFDNAVPAWMTRFFLKCICMPDFPDIFVPYFYLLGGRIV